MCIRDRLWAIKKMYNLDLQAAEDLPVMHVPRKHDYQCVAVDTVMDFLAGEKRVDVYKRQGYRYTGASPVATQIRFLSCRYIALHSLQNTVFFIVAQKKALFQFLYKSFMQNLCRYGIL